MGLAADAALVLIDLQKAIDAPSWGRRNNPAAEAVAAELLACWRRIRRPIVHVRHDSTFPDSTYRPGQPGNDFKPEVAPLPGEIIVAKRTNSAFVGTDLEARLRAAGWRTLVLCGVATSNSLEATARMAGNLGFATYVVADACFTFDKLTLDGRLVAAEDVHALSLAHLNGEYATVVESAWVRRAAGCG